MCIVFVGSNPSVIFRGCLSQMSQLVSTTFSSNHSHAGYRLIVTTDHIRLRLTEDETDLLRALAARCGLQPTDLAAVFVRAALHAVSENKETIPMPLHFEVSEAPNGYNLNETPTLRRK